MRRALLIANPAARGGRSAEPEALAAFHRLGFAPDVHRTTAPGDAARIAAQSMDDGPVFVLGGDGTVMEVAGALIGRGRAVGILPGGTGNQLARFLGIPLRVGEAVRRLHHASTRILDLGRLADGRHFAITAGVGMDAAMIAGTSMAAKRWLGVGAYVLSAVGPALAARRFPVRIEVDGRVIEREAGLAMIANVGSVMGGRFGLGPGVTPDDGWLNLCVVSPRSAADGAAIAMRLMRSDFRDHPRMFFLPARDIRIEAPAGVPMQADGELLTSAALHAVVVPSAAHFLTPAP